MFFTQDVLKRNPRIIGMDISVAMIRRGPNLLDGMSFSGINGDICALPFCDNSFDCVFSMTALKFIPDAALVVRELNRLAKPGGCIALTTLNSPISWTERCTAKGRRWTLFIITYAINIKYWLVRLQWCNDRWK